MTKNEHGKRFKYNQINYSKTARYILHHKIKKLSNYGLSFLLQYGAFLKISLHNYRDVFK